MVKRKVIIIANVSEDILAEGLKHGINEAFSSGDAEVDVIFETSFKEDDEYSLTAMAIESDAETTLENNDIEATNDRIVKLANYVAYSDDLSEEIGDAMDRGFNSLKLEGEL